MYRKLKIIYLDHAATTPVLPEVVKEIDKCFLEYYGNASEMHQQGQKAKEILENSRKIIADSLGSKPDEIIFTSGGSESSNLALFGIAENHMESGGHIITSSFEHPATIMPLKFLSKNGFKITYLPINRDGLVDPDEVKKAISKKTILVSIMHANNVLGTVQPISEIGEILKEKNIIFHTDAVQTFCSIETQVKKLNADLMSISAHKIYGPKGVGALYVRRGIKLVPRIFGGGQEKGIRSGTENIPGIAGFAKAAEIMQKGMSEKTRKIIKMRDYIREKVLSTIDDVQFNGHPLKRLPGNCNFSFKYIEGEAIVLKLDHAGILVSSGSACSSSSLKPSSSLIAIGLSKADAFGSLRVTLGFENTKDEVNYFLDLLPQIIRDLRKISPLYKK